MVITSFCLSCCTIFPYQQGNAKRDILSLQKQLDSIKVVTDKILYVSNPYYKTDLATLLTEITEQLNSFHLKIDATEYYLKQLNNLIPGKKKNSKKRSTKSSPPKYSIHIEKTYHQAREDYITGKYTLALKGFTSIVNQPKGSYTERAIYWTAESFFSLKNLNNSLKLYRHGIKLYPKGKKLCANLFKIGKILDLKKKQLEKQKIWKKLINTPQCKQSNEALRVKDIL